MRVANSMAELESFYESVKREALNYFANDAVFMERFAHNPHHIEVQILADEKGNVVHLFERECSVQRRHQKVIEEAPSPFLIGHDDVRQKLFQVAVQGAKRIGYTNAGTMEFVMDGDRNFYFLEMNTRVQVEHPVSELISGIDIVKEQILIAAGHPLSFRQEDLHLHGHAMESRLYAEDPHEFLPAPGPVKEMIMPGGPFVRVDAALYPGQVIPLEYDPMIAKICAWGRNRFECLRRMDRALSETVVAGCLTNLTFLRRAMAHEIFQKGEYTTGFIGDNKKLLTDKAELPPGIKNEQELKDLLAAMASVDQTVLEKSEPSSWWRMTHVR